MDVILLLFLLLFTVALAVHVGQFLEPCTPPIQMIEILFVILCKNLKFN